MKCFASGWCTIRGNISDVLKTVINQNNFSVNCTSTLYTSFSSSAIIFLMVVQTWRPKRKFIQIPFTFFFTVTKKPEIQDVCEYSICRRQSFRFWSFTCFHSLQRKLLSIITKNQLKRHNFCVKYILIFFLLKSYFCC